MKTFKVLVGILLILLLIVSICFIMYPTIKTIILFIPSWVLSKYWLFVLFLGMSPFIGWMFGVWTEQIKNWYEGKCKEIDNKWKD